MKEAVLKFKSSRIDNKGWGPVTSQFLNDLLKQLVEIDYIGRLPAGVVLAESLV
jgi:hypothetical protein